MPRRVARARGGRDEVAVGGLVPASADERLEQLARDVDERVAALDRALAAGDIAVDVQDGELHVRRLPGAERPAATTALAAHIAGRLPCRRSTSPTSTHRRRCVDGLQ